MIYIYIYPGSPKDKQSQVVPVKTNHGYPRHIIDTPRVLIEPAHGRPRAPMRDHASMLDGHDWNGDPLKGEPEK